MSALTLRVPADKHQRLRALAKSHRTTINRLLNEMTTLMLADHDAEIRFKLYAQEGTALGTERGLALLDKATAQGTQTMVSEHKPPQLDQL